MRDLPPSPSPATSKKRISIFIRENSRPVVGIPDKMTFSIRRLNAGPARMTLRHGEDSGPRESLPARTGRSRRVSEWS